MLVNSQQPANWPITVNQLIINILYFITSLHGERLSRSDVGQAVNSLINQSVRPLIKYIMNDSLTHSLNPPMLQSVNQFQLYIT